MNNFLPILFLSLSLFSICFGEDFQPRQVVRPFAAIVEPKTVDSDAAAEWVSDNELVLGVAVEGATRAYPINMLTNPSREIINDRLGGRSIAATW